MDSSASVAHFLSEALASECVPDSSITFAFVVEKLEERHKALRERLLAGARIAQVSCTDLVSGVEGGATSRLHIFSIRLTPKNAWKNTTVNESRAKDDDDITKTHTVIRVILKVFSEKKIAPLLRMFITDERVLRDSAIMEQIIWRFSSIHNRECDFYTRFASLGLLPLPTVYYVQRLGGIESSGIKASAGLSGEKHSGEGLIIMEDLADCSYMAPFDQCLGVGKVEAVVRHLVSFHAYLIGKFSEDERDRLLHPFKELLIGEDLGGEETVTSSLQHITALVPELVEPVHKLRRVLDRDYCNYCFRDRPTQLGVPNVLVHADLWNGNLLWRKNGEELTNELVALIDWQAAMLGNPMLDLARVMTCCSTEVRRQEGPCMVQLYYEEFCRGIEQYKGEEGEQEIKGSKSGSGGTMAENAAASLAFAIDDFTELYELALVNQAMSLAMVLLIYNARWSNSEDGRKKFERLKSRLVDALKDAVDTLERVALEWLVKGN